jgi:hypothetical protein
VTPAERFWFVVWLVSMAGGAVWLIATALGGL